MILWSCWCVHTRHIIYIFFFLYVNLISLKIHFLKYLFKLVYIRDDMICSKRESVFLAPILMISNWTEILIQKEEKKNQKAFWRTNKNNFFFQLRFGSFWFQRKFTVIKTIKSVWNALGAVFWIGLDDCFYVHVVKFFMI